MKVSEFDLLFWIVDLLEGAPAYTHAIWWRIPPCLLQFFAAANST
jgi:hypothetical protein